MPDPASPSLSLTSPSFSPTLYLASVLSSSSSGASGNDGIDDGDEGDNIEKALGLVTMDVISERDGVHRELRSIMSSYLLRLPSIKSDCVRIKSGLEVVRGKMAMLEERVRECSNNNSNEGAAEHSNDENDVGHDRIKKLTGMHERMLYLQRSLEVRRQDKNI